MNRGSVAVMIAAACLALCAGCNRSGRSPASMCALSVQPQTLTLGAGDSLGRVIYVNDLILAARALNADEMLTAADSAESFELAE
ncbi:MAG: hypothetical protein IT433_04285 [Phycisphaerales bacterium]|nr:hypothetical protein [Phycisphaerales bacterium]